MSSMKISYINSSIVSLFFWGAILSSCSDGATDSPKSPGGGNPSGEGADTPLAELPLPDEIGNSTAYSQSPKGKTYRPIRVQYADEHSPVPSSKWRDGSARILACLDNYERKVETYEEYAAITNKYGSYTQGERYEVTGRFYVKKKENGRFILVDPEGYPYYLRGIASFQPEDGDKLYLSLYGSLAGYISYFQRDFAQTGIHSMGAFASDVYGDINLHNNTYASSPLPFAPSMAFLSAFRRSQSYTWPDGTNANKLGMVFYDGWEDFCKSYLAGKDFANYRGNANILGFFSDNELSFGADLLEEMLSLKDKSSPAYLAAVQFMEDNGVTSSLDDVTDELNDAFLSLTAEKYYKAIADAVEAADPELLYLGSRLHGNVKYRKSVWEQAGKYCDIVAVNYYRSWDPELLTSPDGNGATISDWAKWAPDTPFLVSEFYTKSDEDFNDSHSSAYNNNGAGFMVQTQADRAYAYEHFTLGLLEATNCVGWFWFRFQDDNCNKGLYNKNYTKYPLLSTAMCEINYNVYNLIEFFDN